MSKIIFKKLKNIIGMHFDTKSYLKSNHNHTAKQTLIKQAFINEQLLKRNQKLTFKGVDGLPYYPIL
jgi:hypothetical protein